MLLVLSGTGCVDWYSDPVPPPLPTPEDAYLIWTAGEGGVQTTWLDATGAEVMSRGGLVVAAGDSLWQVLVAPNKVDVVDCGCLMEQPDPFAEETPPAACLKKQDISSTTLHATDGRTVPLLVPELEPWTGDPSFDLDVYGTVGPYMMLVTSTSGYSCGAAHGFYASSFSVLDLSAPEAGLQPIEAVLDQAELAKLAPDAAKKARAALMKGEGGLDGLMDPDAPLSLTALQPIWSTEGLSLTVQLTGDACYACSDGEWSAYTRSHRLSLPQVPEKLRPYSDAPPAPVVAWVSAHPSERWGFSVLHNTPEALAAQRGKLK